ncbi:extracellular solute-binding protein [Thermoclostridium caenicola]|uniref:Carbohydrate ABC transporter substrate-binding protein, CUT1 family n=1 Tax=Thermoclostridium caenicola TaxID=659425 RepID=A0A1M6DDL3_9FIRM|nr:extracellular solute-binding protein [Thermoclostridium caenicola]SHI71387.1 carbohydrate ABC transporter substrate-binding protein, CUT1 family [Thermoclostridium caenicola]
MRRTISILLVCFMLVGLLAGCGSEPASTSPSPDTSAPAESTSAGSAQDAELVDRKFTKTRSITVEVYDRGNDGGTPPENNFYTNFIKEGMLRDHNVEVTFVPVGRWTEVEEINNLLAAGDAPDICVTYSYPTIQTYANMGGVLDMGPYLREYKDLLPNLYGLLTERNLFWNEDPETGTVWAIEALLFNNARINTFVREDWLKKLNLPEPTTLEEFENMLRAFKNNAQLLLGSEAKQMIPFSISYDIGWRADHLLAAFVPDSMTDKEAYINGFDDRHILYPGIKEGVRVLNKWYNEGLIWQDFNLYGAGDTTEDNLMKAGYVGSFIHNWDYPYRNGEEGIQANLQKLVGPDAAYIAVAPFKNDAGVYRKFLANPIDRKIFFPSTNDEPLASLLYLDWISKLENRRFLQIGEEGVTHEVMPDGAIKTLAVTGEKIMNSPNNIDYTITINGLDLGDPELNAKSLALNYAGVDARYIERAFELSKKDGRIIPQFNVGEIKAEEGMGPALASKRDNFLVQAVCCPPDQFDAVWDAGMQDYLNSGGQAIIDERAAKFAQFYEK